MSEQNVEMARAFFAAYNARDVDGVIDLLAPDATVTTLSQHGGLPARRWEADQIRRYFEELEQVWVEVRAEIEDYRVHGEYVVALGRISATGRSSGLQLDRGSQIARVDSYSDADEALEAAGLRE